MKFDKRKAKITNNYETVCREAKDLTGRPPQIIHHDERYYNVTEGRLKMRFWPDKYNTGTLMKYDKDVNNAVVLMKLISETDSEALDFNAEDAQQLHAILESGLGNLGRVVKERHQYKRDHTLIYIDTVEHLGQFVKVEVPVMPDWDHVDTQTVLLDLLTELGVNDEDHLVGNYIDMINGNN